jgi:hypothetical protein
VAVEPRAVTVRSLVSCRRQHHLEVRLRLCFDTPLGKPNPPQGSSAAVRLQLSAAQIA